MLPVWLQGRETGSDGLRMKGKAMRTLIYARTHTGDPDARGRFGVHDCMGPVREWDFQAVVGVGGRGAEAKSYGIAYKLTWVGVGARKTPSPGDRGPLVTFDHFRLFDADGPALRTIAPRLARRFYRSPHPPRTILDDFSDAERAEIRCLLALAKTAPPSGCRTRLLTPPQPSRRRNCRCGRKRCKPL